MTSPAAAVDLLHRSDGSARYSCDGYEALAAVNGPVEVQRRDELPEEAAIEVIVRPAAGVATIRERHFESLIHRVLRQVIRTQAFPRTLVQITLQVTSTPETSLATGKLPQAASNLPLLPVLLNAALLALLCTTIPLKTMYAAGYFDVNKEGDVSQTSRPGDKGQADSVHVLCLNSAGDTLLAESEGRFQLEEWMNIVKHAKVVLLADGSDEDVNMDGNTDTETGLGLMRKTIVARLEKREAWRNAG